MPGKSHGRRSLVGRSSWSREESDTTEQLHFHFSLSCTGEGNGHPLQCSRLENPRDGEPGGLPPMGSLRVGHDCSDLAAAQKSESQEFSGRHLKLSQVRQTDSLRCCHRIGPSPKGKSISRRSRAFSPRSPRYSHRRGLAPPPSQVFSGESRPAQRGRTYIPRGNGNAPGARPRGHSSAPHTP